MAWHCKNTGAYLKESTEAYDNALMAWSILNSRGWSLLAFCGMWGNVQSESGYNPWRWQSDIVLPQGDPRIYYQNAHAYGLCQWDAASKYIDGGVGYPGYAPNFSDHVGGVNDGTAQIYFLDDTAVQSGQYYPNTAYPSTAVTYDVYKAITYPTYSYDWAARAWFHNYERGTWDSGRTTACQYWYETLSGVTPPTPPGRIPIWLLFKIKARNEGDIS